MRSFHPIIVTREIMQQSLQVYWALIRIMVPALVLVKAAQMLGLVEHIGTLLGPAMALMGLPAVLGIVWATTLFTNLFTGLVVYFQLAVGLELTVEQVSVLGVVLLLAHSLPVEGAVANRAGVPWWATVSLRVGGALLLGTVLHLVYSSLSLHQSIAQPHWQPVVTEPSLLAWGRAQLETLALVLVIITALIALMRLLKAVGIERLLHVALAPCLRLLGIGPAATNVTVVGATLGLSYGAGLLIRDIDSGAMSRRDSCLSICFIGLAHSLIEDTLLVLAMGADLSTILWIRLLFAFAMIAAIARLTARPRRSQPVC